MPATRIASSGDRTLLTPIEKTVITLVAGGLSNNEAAHRLRVRPEVISQHLTSIGRKLGSGSRPDHVRAALMTGQITVPLPPGDAPVFTAPELRLLRAIAWHALLGDIAAAAGVPQRDVDGEAARLVEKSGARDRAQLVAFAYAWELLDPR
ncbi:helix-turn-helix transcriptional regulator [Streptomyces sp. NBC_00838]|uniref:LuxR C-terminal-related transcriptional regulator n=1 Tax=Streptomyces sp. NBC_00838 TaxID=2903680 RepID=UPI00386D151B|nr:helix-turn-helix transcriptional regulator [Streptomyces sp. NBC_00838]